MRLISLTVENFRSIKSVKKIRIEPLQSFVGENNSGKSNLLHAIECFLSSGAGGVEPSDFNDQNKTAFIECEFTGLSDAERKRLRMYLLGDRVILRKELKIITEPAKGKTSVKAEYHGYQAEPIEFCLSMKKIEEKGGKIDWQRLVKEKVGLEACLPDDGKVTKTSYRAAIDRFLQENEVEYDQPTVGETQALGIPQNLLSALPEFYILPAITDYSNEIDRRSSSTVFRKLMGDLSERLLCRDPRYKEFEVALNNIRSLLNVHPEAGGPKRLDALKGVEDLLRDVVKGLMPSVQGISLSVDVEEPKDIFAKGISIKIDDGVLTDVLDKGHGMQRCLVFALLQLLMQSKRSNGNSETPRPILLAIEEPELYIHPHSQRLIFNVLKEFSGVKDDGQSIGSDQVLYTTHSPAFIEIGNYERIAVLRKSPVEGTIVKQCSVGILGNMEEKKGFKLLTSFGLKHNELFFARHVILVEGAEDEVGIIATARKLGRIKDLPDEISLSIVTTDGKGDIPKFQKVLNAFDFEYSVLIELDGNPEDHKQTLPILEQLNGNRSAKVARRIEDLLNVGRHFDDQRHAKEFFSDPANINTEMEKLVNDLLPAQ